MSGALFRLYRQLAESDLPIECIRLIPQRPMEVKRFSQNCFWMKSIYRQFLLWVYRGSEERLASHVAVMGMAHAAGVNLFPRNIPLRDGAMYGRLDEKRWFYLVEWNESNSWVYRERDQLKAVIGGVASFQKASLALDNVFKNLELLKGWNAVEQMEEACRYIKAFAMLARHRKTPTPFDRLCMTVLPNIESEALEALEQLKGTNYQDLYSKLTSKDWILYNFARSNWYIAHNHQAVCLRVKCLRKDIPIIDLARLLVKTGRSNQWSEGWLEFVFNEYQRHFTISAIEMQIIKAYIQFPWDLYRLLERYYLNLTNWSLYLCCKKLKRYIDDSENRMQCISLL